MDTFFGSGEERGNGLENRQAGSNPKTAAFPYDRQLLVQLIYDRTRTDDGSREAFISHASRCSGLRFGSGPIRFDAESHEAVNAFADQLVDQVFLPLKALGMSYSRTLDPVQSGQNTGTANIPVFPPFPLICTIGDDDGDEGLPESAKTLLQVLCMLEIRAAALLRSDSPEAQNTVTLDVTAAPAFCRYERLERHEKEDAFADEQSPLLALHNYITHILCETGAGAYTEGILAKTATEVLPEAAILHLGRLMQLRLDGWWDGGGGEVDEVWVEDGRLVE